MKKKERPRKKSRLVRTTTKTRTRSCIRTRWTRGQDFQRRNQNYTNDEFTRNSPPLIRISLRDQASHMGTTFRTMEDHLINAQISHSIEAMEIDLELNLSTIRKGTGETMKKIFVPH